MNKITMDVGQATNIGATNNSATILTGLKPVIHFFVCHQFSGTQFAAMKTLVKQTLYLFCALSLFLFSCTKESVQSNNPGFSAKVNGQLKTFVAPVTAQSVKNANGNYELHIIGTERINNDSSVIIKFVIPDFTVSGGTSASHQLNTNFEGNFIEWKSVPGSTQGKYHFFQNGQLSVQQDAHSYLKGTFHFTCFLFDHQGAKTGEVTVTEGSFSDVIIER